MNTCVCVYVHTTLTFFSPSSKYWRNAELRTCTLVLAAGFRKVTKLFHLPYIYDETINVKLNNFQHSKSILTTTLYYNKIHLYNDCDFQFVRCGNHGGYGVIPSGLHDLCRSSAKSRNFVEMIAPSELLISSVTTSVWHNM